MEIEALLALAVFAFASSITPGPNNLMLMASGANFGPRRTLPHLFGVGGGFVFMICVVGAGLGQAVMGAPMIANGLRAVAFLYVCWLALRLARSNAHGQGAGPGARPMTFLEAAAFQWVNPKAWAMALTAVSVYAAPGDFAGIAWVALVFGVVNVPSTCCWMLVGARLSRWLSAPGRTRVFNVTMAVLLVASMVPVLLPEG